MLLPPLHCAAAATAPSLLLPVLLSPLLPLPLSLLLLLLLPLLLLPLALICVPLCSLSPLFFPLHSISPSSRSLSLLSSPLLWCGLACAHSCLFAVVCHCSRSCGLLALICAHMHMCPPSLWALPLVHGHLPSCLCVPALSAVWYLSRTWCKNIISILNLCLVLTFTYLGLKIPAKQRKVSCITYFYMSGDKSGGESQKQRCTRGLHSQYLVVSQCDIMNLVKKNNQER